MISALDISTGLATAGVNEGIGVGLSRAASTFAAPHDVLFWFITWLCVVFFVILMALAGYFAIKYRRRPGVPQQRSASHNTPLELAWSLGPLAILITLFFWAFDLYMNHHVARAGSEQISVTARQWNWSWRYDNGATQKPEEVVRIADAMVPVFAVPAGRPVRLTMISEDVIHSLYVPDFRQKLDIFPNRYTTTWFEATTPGEEHYLFCTEYCGLSHSQMGALVKVMDEADYQKWKADHAIDVKSLKPQEWGKILFVIKGCNSCHATDKSVITGPGWEDVYGSTEEFTDGTSAVVEENYIRESILNPSIKIVKGFPNQMNSFQGQLTEEEISALIAFMKSLSEVGRKELEAAEAAAAKNAEEQQSQEGGAAPPGE